MKHNIVAIVQARMGSSRLPAKALLQINDIPIVEWVYQSLTLSKKIDQIIFAIPDNKKDDILFKFLESINANVFRGSEEDVLDRFYKASQKYEADYIIRVCADNPFIDPDSVNDLVDYFLSNKYDYAYNHIPRDNLYPDGVGAEITNRKTLKTINDNADKVEYREHLFNYIWSNKNKFKIGTFNPKHKWLQRPELRLDIDTMNDYKQYNNFPLRPINSMKEIIQYIDSLDSEMS